MYKLNESLASCSPHIGRARTFTRGWFENESIWLHMSYKYLLELLQAGHYAEFFDDAGTMLVPFMDPAVYGRSILENSSFLASSANPDPSTHGRGFIARLSGSTAEFIHMWLLLTLGPHPFDLEGGKLRFQLRPGLPGRWFTERAVSLRHEGESIVVAKTASRAGFWGRSCLSITTCRAGTRSAQGGPAVRYLLDGRDAYDAESLGAAEALRIRKRLCQRLDVWLE